MHTCTYRGSGNFWCDSHRYSLFHEPACVEELRLFDDGNRMGMSQSLTGRGWRGMRNMQKHINGTMVLPV